MRYIRIDKKLFCNLSRIPVNYINNPLVITAKTIVKKKDIKFEDTALYYHYLKMKGKSNFLDGLYNAQSDSLKKISKYYPFLPWLHNSFKFSFRDKAFIGKNKKFYMNSFNKLKTLIFSIKANGYILEQNNFKRTSAINGFYLQYNNKKKFYVTRGNHRLAAHISLFPSKKIPIIFENCSFFKKKEKENNEIFLKSCSKYLNIFSSYPTIFQSDKVEDWPAVKNNLIDIKLALLIFKEYFF